MKKVARKPRGRFHAQDHKHEEEIVALFASRGLEDEYSEFRRGDKPIRARHLSSISSVSVAEPSDGKRRKVRRKGPPRTKVPPDEAERLLKCRTHLAYMFDALIGSGSLFRNGETTFKATRISIASSFPERTAPSESPFVDHMQAFRKRFVVLGSDGGWDESAATARMKLPGAGRPRRQRAMGRMVVGHRGREQAVSEEARLLKDKRSECALRLANEALRRFGWNARVLNSLGLDERRREWRLLKQWARKMRRAIDAESGAAADRGRPPPRDDLLDLVWSYVQERPGPVRVGDVIQAFETERARAIEMSLAQALKALGYRAGKVGPRGAQVRAWIPPAGFRRRTGSTT